MKKYQIIYADPPWSFKLYKLDTSKEDCRAADAHYACMNMEDIARLPISEITDKDCALFLWVRNPMLKEGLKLIEDWGFTFKTVAFTWVKMNKKSLTRFWGLGYWTRQNSELCLLATKGKPKRISKSIHSVIDSPIEEHSKKPDIVRDRIVQLMGDLPRIELFARQKTEGWDVWGNEVESDIELKEKNLL